MAQEQPQTLSVMDAIKARVSVRGYAREPNAEESAAVSAIVGALPAAAPVPGASAVRVAYIPRDLGTFKASYGIVSGAKHWIACTVPRSEDGHPFAWESAGYVVERAVIACAQRRLGTVWLGGTFSAAPFAEAIGLDAAAEMICAVTPVGVAGQPGVFARMISSVSGARTRKPWTAMFFDGSLATPLTQEAAGEFAECFEAVRIGPSARNGQPWIIIKDASAGAPATSFHFCRREPSSAYTRLDIGIAMCHWDLACQEKGIAGRWEVAADPTAVSSAIALPSTSSAVYVATWVRQQQQQ